MQITFIRHKKENISGNMDECDLSFGKFFFRELGLNHRETGEFYPTDDPSLPWQSCSVQEEPQVQIFGIVLA